MAMTIPTCFEDLDWSEDAKPTSAHFLALIMAYRERSTLQEPNAFPVLDGIHYLDSTQPYNAISFNEIKYLIYDLVGQIDMLRALNHEFMEEKGDITYEEYLTFFVTGIYWQATDTDFYKEEEHSKKFKNVDSLDEYYNLKAMMASTDEFLMAHRYKEIDQQALMKFLIRHKNFVGKLTEMYCEIGSLGVNRPQYYIDWATHIDADKPSFQEAQQRRDTASRWPLEAFWYYWKGDTDDGYEHERLYFDCNDCDIPYIFKYPAIVSVHCWETRTKNDEPDDSWYYDFGTGLQLGWNSLGVHNLGERIPLLPKQGWGDAKATAVPPKRGANGDHYCSWGIDLIKFDFYNSLKFKVPRETDQA